MNDPLGALLHPFAAGMIDWPQAPTLFLGAVPGLAGRLERLSMLACVQGFRPDYLGLKREGATVTPLPEGRDYAAALVLCSRSRTRNQLRIAEALRRVRSGGLILVGGARTDGAASLRKRVAGLCPVTGSASKYHGLAFWLTCPSPAEEAERLAGMLQPAASLIDDLYITGPGMFSEGRIDPGSALLLRFLPSDLGGAIADFGAGWGHLAAEVARRAAPGTRLDLYEADYDSLQAARANLARLAPHIEARFFWHDLASEPVEARYDAIILNPPFHVGRAAEPGIGRMMIAAAARALGRGGRLFLVANSGLPYEASLAGAFSESGELAREKGYKVLWARR
jgi:16S rRNA (guanine1207-N2)-methyltransferase